METVDPDLEARLQDAVVSIESAKRGTGFFVAPRLIATCYHVVENAGGSVDVVSRGRRLRGTVLSDAGLAVKDLALVEVNEELQDVSCVGLDRKCAPYTPCYGYGFSDLGPSGDPINVRIEGRTGKSLLKLADGQIRPGLSGSPLLSVRTGNVCGVIKSTRDRETDLGGFAIPASELLSHAKVKKANRAYHAADRQWARLAEKQSGKLVTDLSRLADEVRHKWIERYKVTGQELIPLPKERDGSRVPWRLQQDAPLPPEPPERMPSNYSIAAEFDRARGSLLILGDPGAGKTISLIELAEELICRWEEGDSKEMPAVLNLSSWRPGRTIQSWLVDEIYDMYRFPKKVSTKWLEDGQLILLLDGLDETRESDRGACVAAINTFLSPSTRVAVCSRLAEYDSIGTRLEVNGSIILLPLDDAQVLQHLRSVGATDVESLLENDAALLELAHSPLLLNVMIDAYHGGALPEAPQPAAAGAEDRRAKLFDDYIKKMFERRGGKRYSEPYTRTALSRLAALMQRDGRSILLIENLQPTWLSTWRQKVMYYAISRYLPLLPMFGAVEGRLLSHLLAPLFAGAAVGLFDFLREKPVMRHSIPRLIGRAAAFFLIPAGAAYLVGRSIEVHSIEYSLGFGLYALLIFLKGIRRDADSDIELVERITISWSWRNAAQYGGFGFLVGFLTTAAQVIKKLAGKPNVAFEVLLGAILTSIVFGALFALFAVPLGSWKTALEPDKRRPNEGMFLTLRNALRVGSVGAIIPFLTVMLYAAGKAGKMFQPSLLAPFVFFLFWFTIIRIGGMDVIRHYTLRFVIAVSRTLPLGMASFLEHGVHLALLKRVGGGFDFIHGLFREHFSAKRGVVSPPAAVH